MRRPPSLPERAGNAPARRPISRDEGFTLVELMVAVAVFSVVAAFGAGAFRSWQLAEAQRGAATSLQTLLRQTQVRAVTEGVNFCVTFDAGSTYTIHRYACTDAAKVKVAGPYRLGDDRLQLVGAAFTSPDGTVGSSLGFRPTGTAWPGSVSVTRPGSSRSYLVKIEGLTGRVSLS